MNNKKIKLKKGNLTTEVHEKLVSQYINSGWEYIVAEQRYMECPYDKYTDEQIEEIFINRGLSKTTMNIEEMKMFLVDLDMKDRMLNNKPTNEGFTDELIKVG